MMKWNVVPFAFVLALVSAGPAQGQVAFGPQLSYGTDSDLGIGARVEMPLGSTIGAQPGTVLGGLKAIGSFDWFFIDCGDGVSDEVDCSYWELNANAAVPLPVEGVGLYAGGGLNIAHASVDFDDDIFEDADETEAGLNLLAGLNFGLAALNAFAEGRLELGGGEQFVISAGILF